MIAESKFIKVEKELNYRGSNPRTYTNIIWSMGLHVVVACLSRRKSDGIVTHIDRYNIQEEY